MALYLRVLTDGTVMMEEVDDFGRFHIQGSAAGVASAGIGEEAGQASDNHFWLDADTIVQLSGKSDDAAWCATFQAMLEKAEPHGFYDAMRRRIKAHLVEG